MHMHRLVLAFFVCLQQIMYSQDATYLIRSEHLYTDQLSGGYLISHYYLLSELVSVLYVCFL